MKYFFLAMKPKDEIFMEELLKEICNNTNGIKVKYRLK